MSNAHHERKARNPFNSGPGPYGPLKGTGSFVVFDPLSYYFEAYIKTFSYKTKTKNKIDQNLEGVRACCAPWIRHCFYHVKQVKNEISNLSYMSVQIYFVFCMVMCLIL